MRFWLLAMLLGFPLLEVAVLVRLAEVQGWWVLGWLVVAACAGVALLKEARFALVARLGAALAAGQFSIAAFVDSARTVLAGFLLIFPGVISDLMALALLLLPRALPEAIPARGGPRVIQGQYRREH